MILCMTRRAPIQASNHLQVGFDECVHAAQPISHGLDGVPLDLPPVDLEAGGDDGQGLRESEG